MGMMWNKTFLEQPTVPFSDESRYLTSLWVSGNEELRNDEPCQSDSSSSQSIITVSGLEQQMENLLSHHQVLQTENHQVSIMCKIRDALKRLSFREQHVLVQFWSPRQAGRHQLLTTVDQPFGVGVANEQLCFYRRDSEHRVFLVDKDHEEEDISPPARVFRRGIPEWTPDLDNYSTKEFPQLDWAIHCNLHGYLALPVFDPTTELCVGVLELLTSVKYTSYAFEVQQVHKALKVEHLSSPQVFDFNIPKVLYERKQTELNKIKNVLKNVCDVHTLPLAQTWTVSPSGSFVSDNKVIEKTCSSFDTRCIGKVCMSTTSLPFHVGDMRTWHFMKACREQHLDRFSSYVGKALLARGSCYVQNVTELSEDEYPLVHNARMTGLTSCFVIYLHSAEYDDDYVLEFFLPMNNNNNTYVMNLVQTLKQNIEFASGFELGEISLMDFTELPLLLSTQPHTVQISSTTTAHTLMDSSDAESDLANGAKTDSAIVLSQSSSKQNQPDDGRKNIRLKQNRKRKIDSLSMEALKQHIGKPLDQTAQIFGVSRSTIKRFCRKHGISSWPPVPKNLKRNRFVFDPKLSQKLRSEKYLQRSSNPTFGFAISVVVCVVLKVKRWSCSSKKHGFLGKWWSCGKHSYLPFHGLSSIDAESLDRGSLTVKASFKNHMVKFRFPVSSGLTELENQVVQRIHNVKGKRLILKYEDEDKDMVLITCDADLEFMTSNTSVKLVVEAED